MGKEYKRNRKNEIKGERAILPDGRKVICQYNEGGYSLRCYDAETRELVGAMPPESWEWKCPPESLQG